MIELLTSPEAWIAFATLTALELVLGIDNIVVLTIIVQKLPQHVQAKARFIGLALAMIRHGAAARVSALFFLVPPSASLIAWTLLGEEMPVPAFAGMGIAALGVLLVGSPLSRAK